MLVVQDIFLTETAYLADVINTDRFVQMGRQALNPPVNRVRISRSSSTWRPSSA